MSDPAATDPDRAPTDRAPDDRAPDGPGADDPRDDGPTGKARRRSTALVAVLAVLVVLVVAAGAALVLRRADDRLPGGLGGGPAGQVGVAWDRGLLSADGQRIAVSFDGAALGGDQPCGAWYVGLAAALQTALRVTVITIPGPGSPDGSPCAAPGTPRCAEVKLPFAPADEPVLDAMTGVAPPLDRQPAADVANPGASAAGASSDDAPGELCARLTGG